MEDLLRGLRVLVVDDMILPAMDIAAMIEDAGGVVVGPVATTDEGLALAADDIDAAVLDYRLYHETSLPLAHALMENGTPFVMSTAYGIDALPPELREVPQLEKPFRKDQLGHVLRYLSGLPQA